MPPSPCQNHRPALTRPRRSSTLLYMKRVPATEKTHRLATPPHLCIAFSSSSSRPSYRNFKKDIAGRLIHAFPAPTQTRSAHRELFQAFSRVRTASPAYFWASRACALLSPLVFGLLACAHGFPCAFSSFSRVRTASPVCFRASRVCALLPPAYFWASRACARLSPARFRALRVRARLPRHIFGFLASAHGFLSQGGAVLCRSAMRCLRFSCSQTLGLCAGAGGKSTFNSVRTKINIQ